MGIVQKRHHLPGKILEVFSILRLSRSAQKPFTDCIPVDSSEMWIIEEIVDPLPRGLNYFLPLLRVKIAGNISFPLAPSQRGNDYKNRHQKRKGYFTYRHRSLHCGPRIYLHALAHGSILAAPNGDTSLTKTCRHIMCFYEKVIKVKADVAAVLV